MKQTLLGIFSCCLLIISGGCFFTGLSNMQWGDGSGSHGGGVDPLAVGLDVLTFPVQVPLALDYWVAEYCIDPFYPSDEFVRMRYKYVELLEKDFNEALNSPRYFQKFDEKGRLRPEYAALREFMRSNCRIHVHKLTKQQAEYVAKQVLEHQELFDDLCYIWRSRFLDADLRLKALPVLQRHKAMCEISYEDFLDSSSLSDAVLLKIGSSSENVDASYAAFRVLAKRKELERERQKELAWEREQQAEREASKAHQAVWFINRGTGEECERGLALFEKAGVRSEIWRQIHVDPCSILASNYVAVVAYELKHAQTELNEFDCLIPALQNRWIHWQRLEELRPKVVALARRLKDRKTAKELIRAFCGNVGQRYVEPVVCYADPRLSWLREDILRNDCKDIAPAAKDEMRKELDHIHTTFASCRNCDEELRQIDTVLKKYQPDSVPATWLVQLAHEGDTNRVLRTSYCLGKPIRRLVRREVLDGLKIQGTNTDAENSRKEVE